ncbi:unnamed protein product [Pedinophyceae sp. YPF-701]|nr:unnamed protein product [Pedinophyceae sp. YPF-701]
MAPQLAASPARPAADVYCCSPRAARERPCLTPTQGSTAAPKRGSFLRRIVQAGLPGRSKSHAGRRDTAAQSSAWEVDGDAGSVPVGPDARRDSDPSNKVEGAGTRAAPLPGELHVVGFGRRGAAALASLDGWDRLAGAATWYFDTELPNSSMTMPRDAEFVQVTPGAEPLVADAALDALTAKPAHLAQDDQRRVRMMLPSKSNPFGGFLFLLGAAGHIPGGNEVFVRVAHAAVAAGRTVVAALTSPLGFEGKQRAAAAQELVAALQDAGVRVVVVEQEALVRVGASGDAGAGLTVAAASAIADTALSQALQVVVHASLAEDLMSASRGAVMWTARHGGAASRGVQVPGSLARVLRGEGGVSAIGKGALAARPGAAADPAEEVALLAAEAVRAAASGPFLDGVLPQATAVVCALSLPSAHERAFEGGALVVRPRAEIEERGGARRYAHAATKAAGRLLAALGAPGMEVVVCAEARTWQEECRGNFGDGTVEATLLVTAPQGAAAAGARGGGHAGKAKKKPRRRNTADKALWGAMSALAGGTAPPAEPATRTPAPEPAPAAERPAAAPAPPPAAEPAKRKPRGGPSKPRARQPAREAPAQPATPRTHAPRSANRRPRGYDFVLRSREPSPPAPPAPPAVQEDAPELPAAALDDVDIDLLWDEGAIEIVDLSARSPEDFWSFDEPDTGGGDLPPQAAAWREQKRREQEDRRAGVQAGVLRGLLGRGNGGARQQSLKDRVRGALDGDREKRAGGEANTN